MSIDMPTSQREYCSTYQLSLQGVLFASEEFFVGLPIENTKSHKYPLVLPLSHVLCAAALLSVVSTLTAL